MIVQLHHVIIIFAVFIFVDVHFGKQSAQRVSHRHGQAVGQTDGIAARAVQRHRFGIEPVRHHHDAGVYFFLVIAVAVNTAVYFTVIGTAAQQNRGGQKQGAYTGEKRMGHRVILLYYEEMNKYSPVRPMDLST